MFPRKLRFTFRGKTPSNTYQSPSFALRYEVMEEEGFRIAVVASKKVDKRATVRNSFKRRVLSFVKTKNIKEPVTLVFYLKKGIIDKSIEELHEEIDTALKKINVSNI